MVDEQAIRVLVLNSGSSSLKFALFAMGESETLRFSGRLERIGLAEGVFRVEDGEGRSRIEEGCRLPDHDAALARLFEWLQGESAGQGLDAVGHRVVHGGVRYTRPHLVSPELTGTLRELIPLAPDHLPQELKAIEAVRRAYPSLAQVACFDTAFHRSMPTIAQLYAFPDELRQEGVLRFGFHGLSYEYIVSELRREAGPDAANNRVVIAHLGNGSSMAAIRHGKSVDTTMGFTPAGGLVMSTRSGDLDPGVVLYLLREKGLDVEGVDKLVNQEGGLLGLSGISSDVKDLLDKEKDDPRAAEAIELFCYQARKYLASLTAVLGGLDVLVFTAGIGENAAEIRRRICSDLAFLGIEVDRARNERNAAVISPESSPVTVRVMRTNEELMIARHTRELLRGK